MTPQTTQKPVNERAVIMLACAGHFAIHFCIAFYFVIVLSLEQAWNKPYHELISLWTLGSLMVGLLAIPSGLLTDRFGAPKAMMLFFTGMGLCTVFAGTVDDHIGMLFALTGIGIFAAIYHPTAIPWMIRNSSGLKGKALAINGIFGSLGGAAASIVSGFLIDVMNWRAAFFVPGLVIMSIGLIMAWMMIRGVVLDRSTRAQQKAGHEGYPLLRIFIVLMISMFIGGVIYNGTQTALPKVFEIRGEGLFGSGVLGIGTAVAFVYAIGGVMQLVGGHLADRYPLKPVYLGAIALQIPFLWLAAHSDGYMLVLVVILMVVANTSALPAENMLLSRYTPQARQGLIFGVKFLLFFSAAPIAVQTVAFIKGQTGEFTALFWLLAALSTCALAALTLLPRIERQESVLN